MAKEIKQKPASKIERTLTLQHINRPLSTRCAHALNITFWRRDRPREEQRLGPPKSSCFADPELREKCNVLGLAARKQCHRQQMWLLGNCARILFGGCLQILHRKYWVWIPQEKKETKGMLKLEVPQRSVMLAILEIFTVNNITKLL